MAASAMTETIMPPEMLANLKVRVLDLPPRWSSLKNFLCFSPIMWRHLYSPSHTRMDQMPVAKFLKSEQVGWPLSAGNAARAVYSSLMILSHPQLFVHLYSFVETDG